MVIGVWCTHDLNFGCLYWFSRCKEHPCPLGLELGISKMLEGPDWGLASWSWFRYGQWSLINQCSKFQLPLLILKMQRTSCPLSPHLGLWRMLEVPESGLASWSWFRYGHYSLIYPWLEFWLSILILNVQRTSMSLKFSFGALEGARGSWPGFGILIMIWI